MDTEKQLLTLHYFGSIYHDRIDKRPFKAVPLLRQYIVRNQITNYKLYYGEDPCIIIGGNIVTRTMMNEYLKQMNSKLKREV